MRILLGDQKIHRETNIEPPFHLTQLLVNWWTLVPCQRSVCACNYCEVVSHVSKAMNTWMKKAQREELQTAAQRPIT